MASRPALAAFPQTLPAPPGMHRSFPRVPRLPVATRQAILPRQSARRPSAATPAARPGNSGKPCSPVEKGSPCSLLPLFCPIPDDRRSPLLSPWLLRSSLDVPSSPDPLRNLLSRPEQPDLYRVRVDSYNLRDLFHGEAFHFLQHQHGAVALFQAVQQSLHLFP